MNPLPLLVPDRTQLQIALVDTKGVLGFGQLDIRFPQIARRLVRDVGSQRIAAFGEFRPLALGLVLFPDDPAATVSVGTNLNSEQAGGAAVL